MKTYKPSKIAIYGASTGAILTGQVAVRLKHDGLPMPGALGFFTGHADFTRPGDSQALFAVPGLMGTQPPQSEASRPYAKGADSSSPLVSAIFADLTGLPPTLCMTGTRIKLVVQAQSQPDNIATLPLLTATFVRPVPSGCTVGHIS